MASLYELFNQLGIPQDTNTRSQWYMYGHPSGEIPYATKGDNLSEQAARYGAAGLYDRDTQKMWINSAYPAPMRAELFAHEAGHSNIDQIRRELGKESSKYLPTVDANNPDKHYEFIHDLQNAVRDSVLSRNPNLQVTKDPLTNATEFTGTYTGRRYPSNIISSPEETIAALRGLHGRETGGKSFWDTEDGSDIVSRLQQKYPKEYITRSFDRHAFPLTRFLRESDKQGLVDKLKALVTYPSYGLKNLFK